MAVLFVRTVTNVLALFLLQILCQFTREELARQVGCASETIKKIERDERRPSRQIAELLANVLAVPLEEQTLFLQVARGERSVDRLQLVSESSTFLAKPHHNLPIQSTSFIGRQDEIADLKARLEDPQVRLLSITGPGGIGKTRLALQVAAQLVDIYPAGIWLVELAPLSDPALVPQIVATTLGLREQPEQTFIDMLRDYLSSKNLLFVLDNCEHLIEACALFADALLHATPHVKILATSREVLDIAGELSYPVHSLSLPDIHRPSPDTLSQYDAVQLFTDRARAVQPNFSVTNQNALAIAKICARLDGIPLAIELAAARVKVLGVEQIAKRLDDGFRLLTGGSRTALERHQTLRATLDWSFNLLSADEKNLLYRLSVFVGGWTLEAAEQVCVKQAGEFDVLELLSHLIDKSLVIVDGSTGDARYHLLETTRQYAQEKLFDSEEVQFLQARHRDYFLELAERAEPQLIGGPAFLDWLNLLESEHGNMRAALDWSQANREFELGARCAYALAGFWETKGYLQEGRKWLESSLAQREFLSKTVLAKTLYITRRFALKLGDIRTAESYGKESVALFRELDDKNNLAWALRGLGDLYVSCDEKEDGAPFLKEAMALFQEVGDKWGILYLRMDAAFDAAMNDEYSYAVTLINEYQALAHELEDVSFIGSAQSVLGIAELFQGNIAASDKLFRQGLAILHPIGDLVMATGCLEGLAAIADKRRQFIRAAKLWGAAQHLYEITGYISDKAWIRRVQEPIIASLIAQMGETAFEAACAKGHAMTTEQAITYALEKQEY